MEGPTWNLGEEAEVWTRNGPIKVILKRLDNSQNINQDFLNQLCRCYKCLQSGSLAGYFGMTKDPTSCYMFVMRYYENGDLYSYLERIHIQLIQEICSGSRPNIVGGTPPIFTKLMLQCLDADPSNRPTASQLCEYLRNWFIAICDDPDPSELSNQFIVAEAKFANRDNLRFNIIPCHENTIYFSRTLYSIY
ncbi:uncharacterized protein OCT59_023764 [Rhizophagus irregularis]|uniref:Serine-threonine/tyrosine-protein kinase catalytic domain-containing protein n=2 Tax=Rhizophagus irregularis TaxID=588596 RepID=U9TVI9_RHIID|nr:hypothetical protein OCT59_023764 [Rhizophagus irregularis]